MNDIEIQKEPSKKLIELMMELKDLYEKYKPIKRDADKKVEEIKDEGKRLGWTNFELTLLARKYLEDVFNNKQLNYWWPLKVTKIQNNDTVEKPIKQNDDNNDTEQELETPTEITVTTEGSQIIELEPQEDPKDTEIDFLKEKVTELEDALRQTDQFKPATQLQQISLTDPKGLIEKAIMTDEHYFKWLADKADGTHSFYYDRYGFELFQTRILSQLKNSGVKVFKRLYFEV